MNLPEQCYTISDTKFKSKNLWHNPKQEMTYGPEYYTYYESECVYHKGCWSVFHTREKQYDFVYRGHTVAQRAGFCPTIIDQIKDRSIVEGYLNRVRGFVDKVDNLIESYKPAGVNCA